MLFLLLQSSCTFENIVEIIPRHKKIHMAASFGLS